MSNQNLTPAQESEMNEIIAKKKIMIQEYELVIDQTKKKLEILMSQERELLRQKERQLLGHDVGHLISLMPNETEASIIVANRVLREEIAEAIDVQRTMHETQIRNVRNAMSALKREIGHIEGTSEKELQVIQMQSLLEAKIKT